MYPEGPIGGKNDLDDDDIVKYGIRQLDRIISAISEA